MGPALTAGNEQRKQAVRRWKFEKPQDGQVQSPGLGRFLLGGKGVRISAARSRTLLLLGETSMAFSFKARPFMHKLSAACRMVSDTGPPELDMHHWHAKQKESGGLQLYGVY